jgi:hypothetical protein
LGDWGSLQEGVTATRNWARPKRKQLDEFLGVKNRVDEDHPEVQARQSMTKEQEANYVAERYWKISKETSTTTSSTTTTTTTINKDNEAPKK